MKRLFFIVFSILFISCNDFKEAVNELPDPFNGPDTMVDIDTLHLYDKALKVDTLVFETLKRLNIADKVLVVTIKTGFSNDSIEINSCRLDFYLKKKLIQTISVNTYASSEGPIWSLYEDVFTNHKNKKPDHRFFEISNGVPACGFAQSNFLFFVANNEFQLVSKYDSVGDGPYSEVLEFEPYFVDDQVLYFSSKKVVVDTDESKPYNDENEDLARSFSDSMLYKLNHGKWSAELKTPKDKIYRTEFKKYDDLYKQE